MITRIIYPLLLREKISYKLFKFYPEINDKNISIEFSKKIKLDLLKTDVGHKCLIFTGFYELGLSRKIVEHGNIGGLLVDVGANYGYFSCLWASKKSNNKVLAFEASPLNVGPLKNNVNKNELNEQINVIPFALGKEKGNLNFNLGNNIEQTGWGGIVLNKDDSSDVQVKVDTLDNYCAKNNVKKIDVLKIDTEGADTWVLYGAENLLKEKRISHIYFEHNLPKMTNLNIKQNEAEDFLKNLGYIVEKRSEADFYAYPENNN
jgi:FkbM family methyltransferase